jgi:hypothetical protein
MAAYVQGSGRRPIEVARRASGPSAELSPSGRDWRQWHYNLELWIDRSAARVTREDSYGPA